MIQSYFFIPGNHPKLLERLLTIQADYLIIDLEDSVALSQLESVLILIKSIPDKTNIFVRPRLFGSLSADNDSVNLLLDLGFRNFIIPKFRNINDLKQIENSINFNLFPQINFILLIENPESLFFIKEILLTTSLNVVGIGFGSQDYCNESGMDHTYNLLLQPRFIISGIAKAFGIISIDIACMEISNNDVFINELTESEIMGFDAKFTIHPNQLDLIKKHKGYSNVEIAEAEEILKEYEKLGRPTVFVYNGKAVEPPHIINFKKITNIKT